jgi:hypothetical protein
MYLHEHPDFTDLIRVVAGVSANAALKEYAITTATFFLFSCSCRHIIICNNTLQATHSGIAAMKLKPEG